MGQGILTGDRAGFFEELRQNMKTPPGGKAKPVPSPMDGLFTQRQTTLDERKELRDRFIQEWNSLGGQGFSIKGRNELIPVLRQIIQDRNIQKAMCWDHPELESLKLEEIFSEGQAKLARWPLAKSYKDWIGKAAAMDAGIVWGDIAMAETGTIVLPAANPGQPTAVCVLPLTLIVVFTTAHLVDGLDSVMRIFKGRYGTELPTTTTFITGPSRTTDIEMVLTIGVHGSRYVYALILDE